MNNIQKVFYTLLSFVGLLIIVGLILPDNAHIERKINIKANASAIFPHINSMKAFHQWSPWTVTDPNTQYDFSGPESGINSEMIWSNRSSSSGRGSQIITHVVKNERVDTILDFGEETHGISSFYLIEEHDGTQVTWTFDTKFGWDLFSRYIGLFMNKLIGPSYEKGLINLKVLVETKR